MWVTSFARFGGYLGGPAMDLLATVGGLFAPLGAFVIALGALGIAAVTAGVDSRPSIGDDHQRPSQTGDR
jgi:hypothetical protein